MSRRDDNIVTMILEMSGPYIMGHSPALPWRPSTSPGKVDTNSASSIV